MVQSHFQGFKNVITQELADAVYQRFQVIHAGAHIPRVQCITRFNPKIRKATAIEKSKEFQKSIGISRSIGYRGNLATLESLRNS